MSGRNNRYLEMNSLKQLPQVTKSDQVSRTEKRNADCRSVKLISNKKRTNGAVVIQTDTSRNKFKIMTRKNKKPFPTRLEDHPCWKTTTVLNLFNMYTPDKLGSFTMAQKDPEKCSKGLTNIYNKQKEKVFKTQMEISHLEKLNLESVQLKHPCWKIKKPCIIVDASKPVLNKVGFTLTEGKHAEKCSKALKDICKKQSTKIAKLSGQPDSESKTTIVPVNAYYSFQSETIETLHRITSNSPIQVVNHYNYGSVDYKNLLCTTLFVNTNNIITEMCIESAFDFRKAVYSKQARIVDKDILESFISNNSRLGLNCAILQKVKDTDEIRIGDYSNYVKSQKDESVIVLLDHNYAMAP